MNTAINTNLGMDMLNKTVAHAHTPAGGIQSPTLAIPVISVGAILVMLGVYWLLKRFTSWNFPITKKGAKK